ncbi:hypothetical protein BOTBODRAFT_28531 [Botryobasidium botryosum FD-172 SS1]|uniref:D-xylose 1-dehydrogenase (NADP(+), D-xylono-1,5-lactone-forming) n=1 Tax=Botryobasidium botryosum (strain FD-172 SS1) TaxID=930990 RepID=A0A067MTG1_BOTB1|nr:hypothetical protein BOTBODRAFT_28531 [Botryobasidium botryosum FD-172 SS1]
MGSDSTPFVLRWGILGAGHISSVFIKDLLLDPKTRDVLDVAHKVVAIGSRDATKAREYADRTVPGDKDVKAYGSYEELVNDEAVDAVYIGTPHTHHYNCAALALRAKKHVLCEKPFTSNAAELRSLIAIAKENNVFLMEAMWTRFLPIAEDIKNVITEGSLGDIKVLHADLAGDFNLDAIPDTHRILDPKLGGGALLDLGPYPLVWAILALYEHKRNENTPPALISGTMLKTPRTGVDSSTVFTLNFDKIEAQAILSCSITIPSPNPALTIRFRSGNIVVPAPIYRPSTYTIQYFSKPGSGDIIREEKRNFKFEGGGWHFQADEVARCIRDGKLESGVWSLDKSLLQMDIFDEVRSQAGYAFPHGVEQVV